MPSLAIGQRMVWSLDRIFLGEYVEECPRALLVVEILIVLRTMVMRKVIWVPHDFLSHKGGVREV